MPHWDKLSTAQKEKLRELIPSSWFDIKVFINPKDIREGHQFKLNYGCIIIEAVFNNKPVRAIVSAQVSGKEVYGKTN